MISINTNLSSLITQRSLTKSTDALNLAIERMTTGFKINHAKDNAANYSISTNMSTQLNAYDIAADNVASGMDLVGYASDIISQMQDKAARLNALSTQARNGTYGAQSLAAINSEASAIMAEITRLYSTAEYNNISLFNRTAYTIASHLPQTGESGFIDETALISMAAAGEDAGIAEGEVVGTTTEPPKAKVEYNGFISDPVTYKDQNWVDSLTAVSAVDPDVGFTESDYKIATVDDLVHLAELTNDNVDTTGVTFILANDLDLKEICEESIADDAGGWVGIGGWDCFFRGIFDGNGHVIKNLTIDNPTANYQGLFGVIYDNAEIKNVALKNVNVTGNDDIGGLVGSAYSDLNIYNCYATGSVTGNDDIGGLVGSNSYNSIDSCYFVGTVTGVNTVGGISGLSHIISNCFASVVVTGEENVGGLKGQGINSPSYIENSYATGAVSGTNYVGGLTGRGGVVNSFSECDVIGDKIVGGLVGSSSGEITNCYATGDVTGNSSHVGGLVGSGYSSSNTSSITNSYATGIVKGTGLYVGGLAGYSPYTLNNCYATGDVTGSSSYTGGLVGYCHTSSSISNSYATGNVTGDSFVGGLAGYSYSGSISNSYATGNVTGDSFVGGLAGSSSSISNSYATGEVRGTDYVGGLTGSSSSISNSYATGNVTGTSYVGGLLGKAYCTDDNVEITDSVSYSTVKGNNATGNLVGGVIGTYQYNWNYGDGDEGVDEYSDGELLLTNCSAIAGDNLIGGYYKQIEYDICYEDPDTGDWIENYDYYEELDSSFDLSVCEANITAVPLRSVSTTLQIGIYSDSSCQINFDSNFQFDLSGVDAGIETVEAFNAIVAFENLLSEKATQLGAVQNRLESALESIEVNINNLTSSRSTIRDADIAEVSSQYIQQQILQQASATLMATANQMPAIALQLI